MIWDHISYKELCWQISLFYIFPNKSLWGPEYKCESTYRYRPRKGRIFIFEIFPVLFSAFPIIRLSQAGSKKEPPVNKISEVTQKSCQIKMKDGTGKWVFKYLSRRSRSWKLKLSKFDFKFPRKDFCKLRAHSLLFPCSNKLIWPYIQWPEEARLYRKLFMLIKWFHFMQLLIQFT